MKKFRMILSAFVFFIAAGTAVAETWTADFVTVVWRKPSGGGSCDDTDCQISGQDSCAEAGYDYFKNAGCSQSVAPRRN